MAILEKRLNLRGGTNSRPGSLAPQKCDECKRKEKVIGQLYDKMEGLEEAVDAFCKDQQQQQIIQVKKENNSSF